ncbi:hypothetical protein [Nocardia asteroides]|uniref:hypothetical protein n=1 Tax=Nocardia asteroides TaxID=1824 RepID=UPI001E3094AC|nr:hypothetical protein [Nocardia asteroides]UGT61820.1 hypothetical protein LTT61_00225 [Nocardia asteroides]
MRQLIFDGPDRCRWVEVPEPELASADQVLVRPVVLACCDLDFDLDLAVSQGRLPIAGGQALGDEVIAQVVVVSASSIAIG